MTKEGPATVVDLEAREHTAAVVDALGGDELAHGLSERHRLNHIVAGLTRKQPVCGLGNFMD